MCLYFEAGTQWLEPAFGALFKWGTYAALISFRVTTEYGRWQTGSPPHPKPLSPLITHLLLKVKWTSKVPSGFHMMKYTEKGWNRQPSVRRDCSPHLWVTDLMFFYLFIYLFIYFLIGLNSKACLELKLLSRSTSGKPCMCLVLL